MKLAILGTGTIVKSLVKVIDELQLEKFVLLGTINTKEEAEKLAKEYGFSKVYYEYDELLQSDVDTVYIALPNYLHFSFAKKAIEQHKNVIVEKPCTTTDKELELLIRLANQNRCMLFEAMCIPHMPAVKSIKKDLYKLGDIKIVSMNYSQYSRRYNQFKEGDILPVFDVNKAGGALMDLNVYNVSFINYLFGLPNQVQYNANIERKIDTSGILLLKYNDFQIVSIAAKDCAAPVISTIQGDKGYIQIDGTVNGMRSYILHLNDGSETKYNDDSNINRLIYEFKEFIKIIEEQDFESMSHWIQQSYNVSRILTSARKDANIVFPSDEE